MYDDRRYGSAGGTFFSFLLGGAIGAVMGLLFAPRPGKETREMLATKGQEYMEQGKEMYDTGVERATEAYETGVKSATDAYETGKKTVTEKGDELRTKIDETREKLKTQVAPMVDSAKEKVDAVKEAVAARTAEDKPAPPQPKLDDTAGGAIL